MSIREHYKWLKRSCPNVHFYFRRCVLENTISDWNLMKKKLVWLQKHSIREHYKWLKPSIVMSCTPLVIMY